MRVHPCVHIHTHLYTRTCTHTPASPDLLLLIFLGSA